jgi:hypothetical protein
MGKLLKFLQGQRKVLIFFLFIGSAMVASLWMSAEHYRIYIDGLMIVAVAFFAGNGLEHIAGAFQGRKKIDPEA